MVKFSVDQIRQIMDDKTKIRNMSVIAHVDHGKSTLTDALICKAGFLSHEKAGTARWTDKHEKQVEQGITIKSTGVSMCYEYDDGTNKPEEERNYLINLIDSPGHVDFSSEVTAALRVTDGALVVVDTVEGVCVQTQTVLRQAMQERIRPVLIINKVDRAIIELKQDGEEIYQNFKKVIDMVNVVISTYQNEIMGDLTCDPVIGNIAFGAGKDQWAFTLRDFARFYSKKLKVPEKSLMKKLWGDNYFDKETGKWVSEPFSESGKPLKRAFVQFIMDPICELFRNVLDAKEEIYTEKLNKLGIQLNQDDKKKSDKALLKAIMSKWLPAADCLVEMMILHLPSPLEAQKYRTPYLLEGEEEEVREAMEKCDPDGPLMIYISKMVPVDDGRFAAFGRIFSGTVKAGQKVKIIGPNYQEGSKEDYFEKNVSRTLLMIGHKAEFIASVPCGNTVALTGIDEYLVKTGTISSLDTLKNNTIRPMKYSVSPVFRVAVKAANPMDLPKLIEGLRKLSKSDPLVVWKTEETGENIIAGCGELHMEICIHDLRKFVNKEIIVSDPIISYRETITAKIEEPELVKSANKKNRFFGTVEPLNEKLVDMIEKGIVTPKDDIKVRAKALIEEFQWEKEDANRIWTFGPENVGANLIVDQIKGVQYVNEVKDSICSAFQWASKQGILAEENMRGIRFNLTDAMIHQDPAHRKQGQVIPSSRRLFHGLELMACPTLEEPIFMCEITSTNDVIGGIYQTISQRRGTIIEETPVEGSPLSIVKAYLPVSESSGFSSVLRGNTQGKAFPQCFFDHWQRIPGMPLEDAKGANLVLGIRKRKGLKEEIPEVKDLLDKL